MIQLVTSSRAYRTIPLWRRIENQFGQELSVIAKKIIEDPEADLDTLLSEIMGQLRIAEPDPWITCPASFQALACWPFF